MVDTSLGTPEPRRLVRRLAVPQSRWLRLLLAFSAIYFIWGSTYLAIRFAIESLPPLFMAGVRNSVAGALLYGFTRLRGAPRPRLVHWREAAIIGGLMLLGGNGGVTWAEQRIPSGTVALLIAGTPLWIILLGRALPGGARPSRTMLAGVALGLAGVGLLVGTGRGLGGGQIDPLWAGVVLLASFSWAAGSLYSRRARLPSSPFQGIGMEMLAGGVLLLLAASIRGEWAQVELAAISARSALSLAYLIVFGSMVAFTAYVWLLRNTTPARAATYAYVNPVVAVLLGWALASEPLTPQMLLAAAVIVAAVALITTTSQR